jgi:IS4 transposase
LTKHKIGFVTRLRCQALYEVMERRPPVQCRRILADNIIAWLNFYAHKNCPRHLRRIVIWDVDKKDEIVLLPHLMDFTAFTIATIYKDRWQIEIFFKTLKQNLKVKTFVGTSENALKVQIWTALIAMLLVKYLKFRATPSWSISYLIALLRLNLFTYRDLWEWINHPFNTPSLEPQSVQMALPISGLGQHLAKK